MEQPGNIKVASQKINRKQDPSTTSNSAEKLFGPSPKFSPTLGEKAKD